MENIKIEVLGLFKFESSKFGQLELTAFLALLIFFVIIFRKKKARARG